MLRNIQSLRRQFSVSGRYSSSRTRNRIRTAVTARNERKKTQNFDSGSFGTKFDAVSRYDKTGSVNGLSSSLSAAKQTVSKMNAVCSRFDEILDKKLSAAGVPKSVSFKFDYSSEDNKAAITEVSDEKYRSDIQSALDGALKSYDLGTLSDASNIINGNAEQVYYPIVEKALKKCFGQDISKLSVASDGSILGANSKLQRALNSEKRYGSFDAEKSYGFVTKQLSSVLSRLISAKTNGEKISHMAYEKGNFRTDDGEIRFGKDCGTVSFKTESAIVRAAAAGSPEDMELWANNEKLF